MADETETTDVIQGEAPTEAEIAEARAAGVVTDPPEEAKAKKPRTSRKKAETATGAPAVELAPDGLPKGGNRDDSAELDMGIRTPEMGAVPGGAKADAPETPEQKIARLEKELADARAGLNSLVPEEARKAMGLTEAKGALARAGETSVAELPGDGPVTWEGFISKNPLWYFKPNAEGNHTAGQGYKFRGPDNEAEAREVFLRLNGIIATTGKVTVQRVA